MAREIEALSRNPFRRVLSDFLACAPSPDAIAKAAQKSPDRWTQALSIIAKLSGYHEKLEIEGSARVQTMSDAEIEAKIQELIARAASDLVASKGTDQEASQAHLQPDPAP